MRSEEIEQQVLAEDTLPVLAPKPWFAAESDVVEQSWLASATDLLVAWHPEAASIGAPQPADWDRYFAPALQQGLASPAATAAAEPWDIASASLAVDALFRFIRALETMDAEGAMREVSANYHALLHDREVDRDALRLQLDGMIDAWRGPELRIALADIPDPVFHLAGILIRIVLQVDHRDKGSGELLTSLLQYVVWFTEDRERKWQIRTLMPVDGHA